MGSPFVFEMFGGLRGGRAGEPLVELPAQMSETVLAYLALFPPEAFSREVLCERLWPEQDPEAMRQACDEQDRLREELRQKVGDLNVAVELVREVRDDA